MCSKRLHISLFFNGTGNNEENDTKTAKPPHPTNIAKLFHVTTQDGERGYHNYYMPGVGTPFTKIGEPDYDSMDLANALGGGKSHQLGAASSGRGAHIHPERRQAR